MVRGFVMLLCLMPVMAQAISPEELRLLVGDAEREKRIRASRVDANDLSSLLPKTHSATIETETSLHDGAARAPSHSSPSAPAVSTKYAPALIPESEVGLDLKSKTAQGMTDSLRPSTGPTVKTPVKTVKRNENEYIPPARYAVRKDLIRSDAVINDQQRFGIRLGSWIKARVRRDTTSSDPGRVEMVLSATVEGDVRPLAAGTVLFAEKAYNQGTRRLDMRVVKAITPDGQELDVSGLVYDLNEHAGLLGIVNENPTAYIVGTGVKHGVLAAGRMMVQELSGNDMVGALAGTTADAVIEQKQTVLEHNQAPPYTIHVSAQDVFVRVEATF